MSNIDWRADYLDRYYLSQSGWTDGTTEFHRLLSNFESRQQKVNDYLRAQNDNRGIGEPLGWVKYWACGFLGS